MFNEVFLMKHNSILKQNFEKYPQNFLAINLIKIMHEVYADTFKYYSLRDNEMTFI